MFKIEVGQNGEIVASGRFDASRVDEVRAVLDTVTARTTIDIGGLDYISSAGIAVLLATQKRLADAGQGLKLVNANDSIKKVFEYSGLAQFFEIE